MRYLPFAVLAVAMIYTLVDCVRSDGARVRALPKAAWFAVILLLPVLGIVLWFLLGRPQAVAASRPAARPLAPDDDPRFLSDLAERRRRERAAERAAERDRSGEAPRAGTEHTRDEQSGRNGRNPAQGATGTDDAPSP
ncbi:hypothetical protein GCM10011512_04950 [Tersicoccus solisilvae]|uniref:Cardiolipin synthase N-terminal domain-containing protein n=1 Tax=Tersicoccus solisilvae TaxID=1882339 RepID=A0ABQ1NN11_9MICC|nr:PLD nuclease N-terminal domain-containing protein [Tersicoccus solisilvae]GGC81202.1 hypothetical protein GCM10011512_04950 [Tersicoccus solisilvae]